MTLCSARGARSDAIVIRGLARGRWLKAHGVMRWLAAADMLWFIRFMHGIMRRAATSSRPAPRRADSERCGCAGPSPSHPSLTHVVADSRACAHPSLSGSRRCRTRRSAKLPPAASRSFSRLGCWSGTASKFVDTSVLLHPPLTSAGVSIKTKRGCQSIKGTGMS